MEFRRSQIDINYCTCRCHRIGAIKTIMLAKLDMLPAYIWPTMITNMSSRINTTFKQMIKEISHTELQCLECKWLERFCAHGQEWESWISTCCITGKIIIVSKRPWFLLSPHNWNNHWYHHLIFSTMSWGNWYNTLYKIYDYLINFFSYAFLFLP